MHTADKGQKPHISHREMAPYDVEAVVLDNRMVGNDTAGIWFYAPEIARTANAGQFIMAQTKCKFLRRPFSIAAVNGGRLFLLIRIVGEGTRAIASMRRNERLRMLGPLGNSFPADVENPILVGGGIGIAPLLFAAQKFKSCEKQFSLIYGERTAENLLSTELLPKCTKIATDDGTTGFHGTATDLVKEVIPAPVFACGPEMMLKEICKIVEQWGTTAWISMESRMACGFGVCYGCVIRTRSGFKRVCADGPVFTNDALM